MHVSTVHIGIIELSANGYVIISILFEYRQLAGAKHPYPKQGPFSGPHGGLNAVISSLEDSHQIVFLAF